VQGRNPDLTFTKTCINGVQSVKTLCLRNPARSITDSSAFSSTFFQRFLVLKETHQDSGSVFYSLIRALQNEYSCALTRASSAVCMVTESLFPIRYHRKYTLQKEGRNLSFLGKKGPVSISSISNSR
jgi:hypothetical protein